MWYSVGAGRSAGLVVHLGGDGVADTTLDRPRKGMFEVVAMQGGVLPTPRCSLRGRFGVYWVRPPQEWTVAPGTGREASLGLTEAPERGFLFLRFIPPSRIDSV